MKNISGSPPPEGITTLTQYGGLCGEIILRAMLVVALLLVGTPMSDRSKVMTQTFRLGFGRGVKSPTL